MRIIGDDGKPELVNVNTMNAVGQVENDITVGEYDVIMDAGPGYMSKRQAAVDAMLPLLSTNAELFNVAGDLVFRNMDFPGADIIADRLAATNPLAKIDDNSDVPPQVQMQLAQQEQQMIEMQQQLQAAQLEINNRMQVQQIKEQGATERKMLDLTGRAHNVETITEGRINSAILAATASQNRAEIDAMSKLMLKNMDTQALQAEIDRRNLEQANYAQYAQQLVQEEANPFTQLTGQPYR